MDQRLFDDIIEFPNDDSAQSYAQLVGVDDVKQRLVNESRVLLNRLLLSEWSIANYGKIIPLVKIFDTRHPLFIFEGDIGTGKTTLAESFGDELARQNNIHITLFSLSLNARGSGEAAGEMTKHLSVAFGEVKHHMEQLRGPHGVYSSACIFLIDEADAMAESRDAELMHHEDRAGVNGLIQGIDSFTRSHLPAIIVLCTNRITAIDPAVRRRAAEIFRFERPDEEQRFRLFKNYLAGIDVSDEDIKTFSIMTGKHENRSYGHTYSDIVQKIMPALVLESLPASKITKDRIIRIIEKIPPTPPLNGKSA
jgi:SpoVK/Ycf46/Vps4 family AAA+-type ATPase